jgi:hypothetical protein
MRWPSQPSRNEKILGIDDNTCDSAYLYIGVCRKGNTALAVEVNLTVKKGKSPSCSIYFHKRAIYYQIRQGYLYFNGGSPLGHLIVA